MTKKQPSTSNTSLPITPIQDLIVHVEYIRDLNVKIPNAPQIYSNMPAQADATVTVNVNAQQLEQNQPRFEVVVILTCKSKGKNTTKNDPLIIFEIDLQYGAIVTLPTLKTKNIQELLMIHTPNLLFPEIRNLILNITRASNLPSVLLQHIDFAKLWQEKLTANKSQK